MALQYRPFATDRFRESVSKLDKAIRARVDEAISKDITADPYASDLLKHFLKGKREYRVGDYRVVFAICEECRAQKFEQFNGCKDCHNRGRNDIILFDVGHRGRIYKELERLQSLILREES